MAENGAKEFSLSSVFVNQGTCTPVKFKIGYESQPVPMDALAELTYNQCYNYFNWTGAVRVPGVLQNANKLAKQYSESMKEELATKEKNSDLKRKLFFL
jgi:aubergine-like protein